MTHSDFSTLGILILLTVGVWFLFRELFYPTLSALFFVVGLSIAAQHHRDSGNDSFWWPMILLLVPAILVALYARRRADQDRRASDIIVTV